MPQYVQIKENNRQNIIEMNNANNSSESSSNESKRRQHKCKNTIKAKNLRDTVIESYSKKKRGEDFI
eukprot:9010326-Ditylum_brightwellii.AAC.1